MIAKSRLLRVSGGAAVMAIFLLEGACSSGQPAASTPSRAQVEASERLRARAWDPSRRFKALFKAEVSPKVGAIGRGYLSVWWDAASGSLAWRTSAPIAGNARGGVLRVKEGEGDAAAGGERLPLSARLSAADLIACILGTPDAPASPSMRLDAQGRIVEMRFPKGEVVAFQPGDGVPRRIEANGPDGRAVLTLESYGPWPAGDEVPPP